MGNIFYMSCMVLLTLPVYNSQSVDHGPWSMVHGHTSSRHPFYISVTEINHNAKDKTFEISCKMFAEDLEEILEKNYKSTLDISAGKDKAQFDRLIPDYIQKHLNIAVNGKPASLQFVGYETEKESVFCYFQINDVSKPDKVDVTNQILYDFNSSETNIIHLIVNGARQSVKLNYPEKSASFKF
jgi:CRISPR/Cas system endoribonuclease Cas6 (RAMP superfamily)